MASYLLRLETVWPNLIHRSQCCDIESGRNFLNQKLPRQRSSSSLHFCIFCLESESQASTRKHRTARPGRASKSDADLRTELQLFLASAGLPPDQVPSTTELSNRGREDLAKIVRRRGYKAVARLLSNPNTGANVEIKGNVASTVKRGAVKEGSIQPPLINGSARAGRLGISDDDTVQGLESLIEQPEDHEISFREDGDREASTRNDTSIVPSFHASHTNLESLTAKQAREQLLRQRAVNFLKTGQLDHVEDYHVGEEEDRSENDNEDSSEEGENERVWAGQNFAEAMAVEKAARLRAKLLPYVKGSPSGRFNNQGDDVLHGIMQRKNEVEDIYQGDSVIQSASIRETQLDLDHIKSALHSREMELLGMSRELEEAKAQLALVQAKSKAELAQAKQLAVEKDIHLKSADEALANLKKVQIEYWGEGQKVELAGSFNGWTHFVGLEQDPTSEITKSDGSRGPMMWELELWLYPGIYEIKFIVDGNWQIDERREVLLRNSHLNNILRVEP